MKNQRSWTSEMRGKPALLLPEKTFSHWEKGQGLQLDALWHLVMRNKASLFHYLEWAHIWTVANMHWPFQSRLKKINIFYLIYWYTLLSQGRFLIIKYEKYKIIIFSSIAFKSQVIKDPIFIFNIYHATGIKG